MFFRRPLVVSFILALVSGCSSPATPADEAGISTGGVAGSGVATGGAMTGGAGPSGGAPEGSGGAMAGGPNSGGAGASSGAGGTSGNGGGNGGLGGGPLGGTSNGGGAGDPITGGAGGSAGVGGAGGAGAGGAGAMGGGAGLGTGGSVGGAGSGAGGAGSVCTGTPARVVNVHVIGDSTASVYASDLLPRMGWGQPLGELFGPACATVKDEARSGRSSKSFIDEGHWTPIKNALVSGDYVLIQFGHNDEKEDDPLRYTEPQTTFKQYLTTYINDSKAKGAVPMLLTPIPRNSWSGTMMRDTHGAYPAAMRELAQSLDVALIDLTALTETYFERIGPTETAKHFLILAAGASPNYPDGVTDNTHLQEYGARKIGQLAMADAYSRRLPLSTLLRSAVVAP